MKIEKITPFLVDRFLLVRVYTDQGIIGNGEAGLWAHHRLVYEAIQELSEY
jgi:galactonate dehydratase